MNRLPIPDVSSHELVALLAAEIFDFVHVPIVGELVKVDHICTCVVQLLCLIAVNGLRGG